MRIVSLLLSLMLLSGCATDGVYNVGKVMYVGGKQVIVANSDLLDEGTLYELRKIDRAASTYDGVRTEVKKTLDAVEDLNGTMTMSDTNSTAGGE